MSLAWHYVRGTGADMKLRDGRPAVVGEWLEHTGPVGICASGLHASWRAFDALSFVEWEGGSVCLVDVDGVVTEQTDKFVCTRRRIVFAVACDELLRMFSRECALSVLHLWRREVPAVVREYLETGREDLRAAAWAAARDAARAAAWASARAAAWASARDAARAAKISDLNATLESLIFAAAIQDGFDPEALS